MPKGFDWSKVYVMQLHGGTDTRNQRNVIMNAADAYKEKYTVPRGQNYTNDALAGFGWIVLRDAASQLTKLTLNDKLMVCAHGSSTECADYKAADLAKAFYRWGLRNIGLITFKACDIGIGDFLKDFNTACSRAPDQIRVGWLKGYKGSAVTVNGAHEEIRNPDYKDDPLDFEHERKGLNFEGAARYRVFPGWCHSEVEAGLGSGGRYKSG